MIAVLFEVWPNADGKDEYLNIAAGLLPRLEAIEGFVSIERYQSLTDPDKILALSFFRDEAAVTAWRETEGHRTAQAKGRANLFDDYRLRIAEVVRDYSLADRDQAPADSQARHG